MQQDHQKRKENKKQNQKNPQMNAPLQHGLIPAIQYDLNGKALSDIGRGDRTRGNLFGKQWSLKLKGH